MSRLQAEGLLLFLFIPLVLWLFVGQPEPLGLALLGGVALMVGHRFLARPYMARARAAKCLWCNRSLRRVPAREQLTLEAGGAPLTARACPGHGEPVARFFAFTWRWRALLRAGIFLPLLLLLGTLGLAATGAEAPRERSTAIFQLAVGLTVNLAALGPWLGAPRSPSPVAFPAHNFFLLGTRNLLWIFRLVGLWWIVAGLLRLTGRG